MKPAATTLVYIWTPLVLHVAHAANTTLIKGSGSSFQNIVQQGWIAAYNSLSFSYSNTKVVYNSLNSGQGAKDAISGTSLWGSSDALPTVLNATYADKFTVLPLFGGAISIVYNLPGITKTLILSRETVLGVFNGTITMWDDPLIVAINPLIALPSVAIKVVVRKDGSGTSTALTQFFSSVSTSWQQLIGASSTPNWAATGVDTIAQQGFLNVAKTIVKTQYTIGYMDLYDAIEQAIPYASLINQNGDVVVPSTDSAQIALAGNNNDFASLKHVDSHLPNAYPITTFTYVFLNREVSGLAKPEDFRAAMRYIYWTYSDPYAQRLIARNNYVNLPTTALAYSIQLMESFQFFNGTSLYGSAVCDIDGLCQNDGVCSVPTSPFIPASVPCVCNNKLYANDEKVDCSEPALADYVDHSDGIASFMTFLAVLGLLTNAFIAQMLIARANHPLIKAISPTLCLFIVLGCSISYSAVFLFGGAPTDFTCSARPFWLSLAFGLTFGMITAKNYRIFKIFGTARRVDDSLSDKNLVLRFGAGICSLEMLLSIIWVGVSSLKPGVLLNSSVYVIKTCVSGNSAIESAFSALLYLFNVGLLFSSMYYAYLTRLAGEKFNESKALSVSLYITVLILVVALPLIYSTILDSTSIYVLSTITLIICPAFITSTIFGPKVYELYLAKFFKKELAYDVGNIFSRTNTTGTTGNKTFGDISQSGLSFWQFTIKKKGIGATVQASVLTVIPELNWLCTSEDITSSQLKVFESCKLSECTLSEGETPESCFIKAPGGGFALEHQSKDMMSRFKKYFARVVQSAVEINKANAASKIEKSNTVSTVEDV